MEKKFCRVRDLNFGKVAFVFLSLSLSLISTGCDDFLDDIIDFPDKPVPMESYNQVNLVASTNEEYDASRIEPRLVNAWGITFNPTGVAWINAEDTGLSFVYDAEGKELRPPVAIPSPDAATGGTPTGIVFNNSSDFKLADGNPARFIFAGTDGVISAWNAGDQAEKVVDNSADSGEVGAVYTGLALVSNNKSYLYGANFSMGKIDVFDKDFEQVNGMEFTDPDLPQGYSPFNIQAIDGKLYVLYAKVGADGEEEKGMGNGFVSVFNPDGSFVKRFASRGTLDAPWGIAKAPGNFIKNSPGAILIGNFGDGRINVYSSNGKFLGQLENDGDPITIDGLWGIEFPPGTATGVDPNRLYFAAGPDDESEGLFGYITK
ncbi:TIGR03118 family protein [Pontibacter sp. HJ8]